RAFVVRHVHLNSARTVSERPRSLRLERTRLACRARMVARDPKLRAGAGRFRDARPSGDATLLLVGTYAFFGTLAVLGSFAFGRDPLAPRWLLGLDGSFAALARVARGAVAAAGTIAASRVAVRASAWGRALHADLRPAVSDASDRGILVMALASGIGEELV